MSTSPWTSSIIDHRSSIVLCPGQGAQHVGMGKAWAEKNPVAAATFREADAALGLELSNLCFAGPEGQLNRTDVSQPALYACAVACFRALGVKNVSAAAGLSLGEFTALHLAGVFDFVTGLRLVRLRGQAMQEAAEKNGGSMVAITGDVSEEKINELCDKARGNGVLVPANFNSPMQVVVSGSKDACQRAVQIAGEMGLKPTPLTVAGAFHSPLMQPAAEKLAQALDKTAFNAPRTTVMSNVSGQPHTPDVAAIKQRLVEQLTSPVRWDQDCQWLVKHAPGSYIELAPGKVLSGLMRRIDRNTKVANYSEPA